MNGNVGMHCANIVGTRSCLCNTIKDILLSIHVELASSNVGS